MAQLYPPEHVDRPRTRGACLSGPRPCPYVGCRYNLYLDTNSKGSIKLNFPGLEPWELGDSCALDIAELEGGIVLEDISLIMNITRERVRQIEERALARLRSRRDLAAIAGQPSRHGVGSGGN